jgi:uncharacterized cupredoxin-like copper-binding protein
MRYLPMLAALVLAGCATGRPVNPAVQQDIGVFSNAQTVDVHLANFDFTPPVIRMRAGRPYRLALTNDSDGPHNFAAPRFFAAARVAPRDARIVARGRVELRGGESRIVHVIPARGVYKVKCSHLGHAILGMTARIVVE